MTPGKVIGFGGVALFALIGMMALFKNSDSKKPETEEVVQEVSIVEILEPEKKPETTFNKNLDERKEVNLVPRLFATDSSKLPIVETITYTTRVPWLSGRPAWIADYASFYDTSRHFIARSLNRKADYFTQKVSPGDRFNVLKKDKDVEFYLLIDMSETKLYFYYYDKEKKERVLLKTYPVGLGRKDTTRASGYLTPLGRYKLGDKIAVYKPGTMGYFRDQKVEMIQVFGTRWIPFSEEIVGCTESPKGYGIHGSPFKSNHKGELLEDREQLGKYDGDGCIRLAAEDIEELFSIIITKPSYVEIVKHKEEAQLPGQEVTAQFIRN